MANDRLTQETVEVAVNPTSQKARLTQEVVEVAVLSDAKARLTKETVEVAVLPNAKARMTNEVVEVIVAPFLTLTGQTTPTAGLVKVVVKKAFGALTNPAGVLRKVISITLSGSTSPTGVVANGDPQPAVPAREAIAVYDPDVYGKGAYADGSIVSEVYGLPSEEAILATTNHHGVITPTGTLINTFVGVVVPAPPVQSEGGGRWTPIDPWVQPAHRFDREFEGAVRPSGVLVNTVIRGVLPLLERAEPQTVPSLGVPLATPPVSFEVPGADKHAPSSPGSGPVPLRPVRLRPLPQLRPTVEPSLDDTPTVVEPEPVLQPEPVAVTPEAPAYVAEPEPILLVTPTWPLAPRPHVERVREAEPVALEEAFITSTRLPLYTREELMALGRRLRVGFHAPEGAKVAPPSPVVPAAPETGVTSDRTAGAGRRATASRPRERSIPGGSDRR